MPTCLSLPGACTVCLAWNPGERDSAVQGSPSCGSMQQGLWKAGWPDRLHRRVGGLGQGHSPLCPTRQPCGPRWLQCHPWGWNLTSVVTTPALQRAQSCLPVVRSRFGPAASGLWHVCLHPCPLWWQGAQLVRPWARQWQGRTKAASFRSWRQLGAESPGVSQEEPPGCPTGRDSPAHVLGPSSWPPCLRLSCSDPLLPSLRQEV